MTQPDTSLIGVLHVADYAAIGIALLILTFGLFGLSQAKPNGTVFGLQMALLTLFGLGLLLFSLFITWITP